MDKHCKASGIAAEAGDFDLAGGSGACRGRRARRLLPPALENPREPLAKAAPQATPNTNHYSGDNEFKSIFIII